MCGYVRTCGVCGKEYDIEFGGCDCPDGFPLETIQPKNESKDKLSELELGILNYYLSNGYKMFVDQGENDTEWSFKVEINSRYKFKLLTVWLKDNTGNRSVFECSTETVEEMYEKSFTFFNINK